MADQLAECGADNLQCKIGRFATSPPLPIVDCSSSSQLNWFKQLSLDQQYQHISSSLSQAAQQSLTPIPPLQRKSYLTPTTWAKILHLQTSLPNNIQVKPLQQAIKTSAKKDRAIDIANRLLSDSSGSAKDKWQTIRSLNKNILT